MEDDDVPVELCPTNCEVLGCNRQLIHDTDMGVGDPFVKIQMDAVLGPFTKFQLEQTKAMKETVETCLTVSFGFFPHWYIGRDSSS